MDKKMLEELLKEFESRKLIDNITFERNEYLVKSGNNIADTFMIVSGSVRVFRVNEEAEQNIRFGYNGSMLCALDSFLSDEPTKYYIQALKKTEVLRIRKSDFKAIIKSDTKYLKLWIQLLEDLALQFMEREEDLLCLSPTERYHRLFKRSPRVFQEISNKHIASYLRMSPETLSRIKTLDLNQ